MAACDHAYPLCREIAVVAATVFNADGSSDSSINVFCSCCGTRVNSYSMHLAAPLDRKESPPPEDDEYE